MSLFLKVLVSVLILLVAQIEIIKSSRILAIFPVPFRDHQVIFRPLIESLLERDHIVTVITTDPYNFANDEMVKTIDLSFAHRLKVLKVLKDIKGGQSESDMLRTVFSVMRTVAEAELKSPQIQELLSSETEQFDAVLVDWSGPDLMNAFAYKFKAPLIGITPGGAYITSHEAIGNPNHPVAFPSILMPFSENLNLFQRIASAIFTLRYRYMYFSEELPQQNEIAKNFFGPDTPDLWEIKSNVDLLLVNTYQVLGNSRPIGPTTIHLGGIHARKPKSLTWDLQNFLDNSNDVVYINLGGAMTNRKEKLMRTLEKSSFDIVWNMNGITENVFNTTARMYQSSFVPQEDVLAHENVRLFITEGGQRDIEDAIHHKVPVLGFTFTSNVEHYLLQMIKNEAGLVSNFDIDSSTDLLAKIETFAITERYQTNVNNLNRIVTDQPMTSLQRATWWIEYVIRNGGSSHLKSSWNKFSWFKYLLIDVFITVTITILLLFLIVAIVIVRIRRYSKSLPFEKVTRRTKAKML